jgi:NADPH:quinone reductase-like Zn-dependent oxidoreductase
MFGDLSEQPVPVGAEGGGAPRIIEGDDVDRVDVGDRGVVAGKRQRQTRAERVIGDAVDCDYVLHVASPFPPDDLEHEEDVIVPPHEMKRCGFCAPPATPVSAGSC